MGLIEAIIVVFITAVLTSAGTVFVMYLRGSSSRADHLNNAADELEKRIRDMETKVTALEKSCTGFEKQFARGDGKFESLQTEIKKICRIVTAMDIIVKLIARKNGLDISMEDDPKEI